ncbi:di-trans,poly-cis-decaprenylcistransferase [Helicobacter cholecystus]|uniref:Isoprenyl transferase n=1 Tax=Helicobacter cholecystus TaxID=45498 RepID=A0A3D8IXF6_9HELI|nr:di-trans,poly-cis-decaprenylcistransferase [Helicobacter cholecystus]RDU69646.1 di-trans,poly-cis-decaprenylcistransferase [Helicobacter cholecystus]VEJ24207.1 undecaprenyl diphosphate synthetase [Helicobacter cholecystus]
MGNILRHLAIIMDGNGRWAQNRRKKRIEGHKKGAKVVDEITRWCVQKEIDTLTLYAFSTENWKRPKYEVEFLMKMLKDYLESELEKYQKYNIRFFAIGDMQKFSTPLKERIAYTQEVTKYNSGLNQVLALNYGSRNEISRAIGSIAHEIMGKNTDQIQSLISSHLDTKEFGDVDLLIRTGGEQRLSNFLLWQCSYAELYFSSTLWPDFTSNELENIIKDYQKRKRRFGGL